MLTRSARHVEPYAYLHRLLTEPPQRARCGRLLYLAIPLSALSGNKPRCNITGKNRFLEVC
jgi:hypothetical protein